MGGHGGGRFDWVALAYRVNRTCNRLSPSICNRSMHATIRYGVDIVTDGDDMVRVSFGVLFMRTPFKTNQSIAYPFYR